MQTIDFKSCLSYVCFCSLTGFQEIGRRKEEGGVGPDEGQVRSEYTRDRQEVSEDRRECVNLRDAWFVCEWTCWGTTLIVELAATAYYRTCDRSN